MRFTGKSMLGGIVVATMLSMLLINAGSAHTHTEAANGFPGAYGFRPGEWQYITTTTGPLIGTSRTTSTRCSRSFYQPQDTVNATLSTPGSPPGTMHCVTTHPSRYETMRNCKTISIVQENGTARSDVITTHTRYTGKGTHFQMQEHFRWINNGQLFESGTTHGKWLRKTCLAHPPASKTEQIKPSRQMQHLQALAAKAKAAVAQAERSLPAGTVK